MNDLPNQPSWPLDGPAPKPEIIPAPTYAPVGLALGAVLLLWGLLTSFIVAIVGLVIFVVALASWIGGLIHERG